MVEIVIIEWQQIMLYVTVAIIAGFCILIWLIVRSSNEYTQEDNERDADEFAGVIRDSHGPVTLWLWVTFSALTIWIVAYFVLHWAEFVQYPLP
jgi:hypothetical protein